MDPSPYGRYALCRTVFNLMKTDIRIYCQSEQELNNAVEMVELCNCGASVSTWEPDGDEGTWGAFVDDIDEEHVRVIKLLYKVEQ